MDADRAVDVVCSYRLLQELSRGDAADRARADAEHSWAWEAVNDAVVDGDLPVQVLDAMLHDPLADDRHRAYVAAGPIEDLLTDHSEEYAVTIAERCDSDRVWAEVVAQVWLEPEDWDALPASLRRRVPDRRVPARRTSPATATGGHRKQAPRRS